MISRCQANAGLLAVSILATTRADLWDKLWRTWREIAAAVQRRLDAGP